MAARMQTEGPWRSQQLHACLFRCPAALPVIAAVAARHQVFPSRLSRSRTGHDVVKRHLPGRHGAMAILARIAIAHEDILARKCPRLVRNTAVFQQSNHRRNVQASPSGVNLRRSHFFSRGDTLQNEHQRAAGCADIDWLVTRVQNQDWLVKPICTRHFTILFFEMILTSLLTNSSDLWALRPWSLLANGRRHPSPLPAD